MPVIIVNERFKIAVSQGNEVVTYEPGEHEVTDRVAEVAIKHLKVAKAQSKIKGGGDASTSTGQTAPKD